MQRGAGIILQARLGSSRLPGKALADIGGRPMIEHVYRRTAAAASVSSVLVATDDERILEAVRGFGGVACLTSPDHLSGTDRLAEVAVELGSEIIVNVQGDEPLIEPSMIDEAVEPLLEDPMVLMSTLRRRIDDPAELQNPNVTKVVVDRDGYALYFSRAPIPFTRDGSPAARAWRHVGLYVYRPAALRRWVGLAPTAAERAEKLEQLRALHHGLTIGVARLAAPVLPGVDTPDDLHRAEAHWHATREHAR